MDVISNKATLKPLLGLKPLQTKHLDLCKKMWYPPVIKHGNGTSLYRPTIFELTPPDSGFEVVPFSYPGAPVNPMVEDIISLGAFVIPG